jgi:4'-phosphopantetheinyl transferase
MPLLKRVTPEPSVQVGIWKIEETTGALKGLARLSAAEEALFDSFKNETRRKQWLSYRVLLDEMLPGRTVILEYDVYGKPSLQNSPLFLSISHSKDRSAVIISDSHPVGIDIERISGRIERITGKFLTPDEEEQIGEENRLEKLYVVWGAKESLYKIHGKPEVELQRDIQIESFDYLCSGKGRCNGRMRTPHGEETFSIFYEETEGFMLVYAIKEK